MSTSTLPGETSSRAKVPEHCVAFGPINPGYWAAVAPQLLLAFGVSTVLLNCRQPVPATLRDCSAATAPPTRSCSRTRRGGLAPPTGVAGGTRARRRCTETVYGCCAVKKSPSLQLSLGRCHQAAASPCHFGRCLRERECPAACGSVSKLAIRTRRL